MCVCMCACVRVRVCVREGEMQIFQENNRLKGGEVENLNTLNIYTRISCNKLNNYLGHGYPKVQFHLHRYFQ